MARCDGKGFPDCASCINREHDPFECEDCEDASNWEGDGLEEEQNEDTFEELSMADLLIMINGEPP